MPSTILDKETDHSYYCAPENFYAPEVSGDFATVTGFLDVFEHYDIDMNLVFRYDVFRSERGHLSVFIAMILQRKGIYKPIRCERYDPATEGMRLETYLRGHLIRMLENWAPLASYPPLDHKPILTTQKESDSFHDSFETLRKDSSRATSSPTDSD
jgi:hypothetical protein